MLPINAHNDVLSESVMAALVAFKQGERKDDPTRQHGIHGPAEELHRLKTGQLPTGYYEPGDPEPWGLRVVESRRNILWQVLKGMLDQQPGFAADYMALALDKTLSDEDYTHELKKLNHNWFHFWEYAGTHRDHHHHAMIETYEGVECPACSILTAQALEDGGMHAMFTGMLEMTSLERRNYLVEQGLINLLDEMIPDTL